VDQAQPRPGAALGRLGRRWRGAGTVARNRLLTVSLLIASLALKGDTLAEAKLGILSAVVAATRALTWIIFRLVNRLPVRAQVSARLLGTAEVHHRPGGAGGPGP